MHWIIITVITFSMVLNKNKNFFESFLGYIVRYPSLKFVED